MERTFPPFLSREGESSYVLLGEDRLSKAKARRGRTNWREPLPEGRRGANYAKGSAGAGASSAGEASLGFVEVSADLDLGLEPFGFLSM